MGGVNRDEGVVDCEPAAGVDVDVVDGGDVVVELDGVEEGVEFEGPLRFVADGE